MTGFTQGTGYRMLPDPANYYLITTQDKFNFSVRCPGDGRLSTGRLILLYPWHKELGEHEAPDKKGDPPYLEGCRNRPRNRLPPGHRRG